jgi:hypothetical protein
MKRQPNYYKKQLKLLRANRIKAEQKKLIDITLRGSDHYVFFNDLHKAQVVSKGEWVTEHIKTAILYHNVEIDKINKMLVNQFKQKEKDAVEKVLNQDPT